RWVVCRRQTDVPDRVGYFLAKLRSAKPGVMRDLRNAVESQLARAATLYLFSYGVSLGISFILLPVFTFYIDPEGYGHFASFQVLLAIAAGIIGLSFQNPLIKVFSGSDGRYQATFLTSCLALMCCAFLVLLTGALLARHYIENLTDLSVRWIIVAAVAGFAFVINQASFTILQATQRPVTYAVRQIIFGILSATISIFLVIGLKFGWSGRAAAAALVPLIAGSWGLL